jgi:hypothetical protein
MVMQFFDAATYGIGGASFIAHDWTAILFMGLGAGSGSLTAMWVDRNFLRKPKPVPGERPKLRVVR